MLPRLTLIALLAVTVTACDSAPGLTGPCEPAALPIGGATPGASVAVEDAAGCRVDGAGAAGESREYPLGQDQDWDTLPTFLVGISVPTQDGVRPRFAFESAGPPAPGRYPIMDLRGSDGRFGPLPARFHPDSVYSWTSNGDGQGWWFATGGAVVVERSDSTGVTGTVEATYLHGGGGKPVTVRARFRADYGATGGYDPYTNPHGG